MNKKLLFTLGLMAVATVTIQAQDDDDLYFTPSKKQSANMSATIESVRTQGMSSRPTLEVYSNNNRSEDEYNRRYSNYAGSWQTGGSSETDQLMATVDSLEAEIEMLKQGGYDVCDPETDYIYSRRLLRFHSPRLGLVVSSPYYWDLVYGYGIYDYLYDPFYDYLYDPFYWNFGWGYGYTWGPWSTWYGPLYGWYAPHHWDYWGVGPLWNTGYYGSVWAHSGNYRGNSWNRGSFTHNRFSAPNTMRTSALAASGTRSGSTLASQVGRTSATQSLANRTRATSTTSAVGRTSSTRATGVNTRATGTTARTSANSQGVTRSAATSNTNRTATTTNRTATTTTNRAATTTTNRAATTTTSRTTTTRSAGTATTTTRSASTSSSVGSYSGSSSISRSAGSSMSSGMSSGGGVSRSAGSSGRR